MKKKSKLGRPKGVKTVIKTVVAINANDWLVQGTGSLDGLQKLINRLKGE